mmetsp:Transcript_36369/g.116484  ORF Transcript_36369/g.116484 Transcript_36369/m.116484 type:complete len:272 (-) Transcript_36369:3-818(-)
MRHAHPREGGGGGLRVARADKDEPQRRRGAVGSGAGRGEQLRRQLVRGARPVLEREVRLLSVAGVVQHRRARRAHAAQVVGGRNLKGDVERLAGVREHLRELLSLRKKIELRQRVHGAVRAARGHQRRGLQHGEVQSRLGWRWHRRLCSRSRPGRQRRRVRRKRDRGDGRVTAQLSRRRRSRRRAGGARGDACVQRRRQPLEQRQRQEILAARDDDNGVGGHLFQLLYLEAVHREAPRRHEWLVVSREFATAAVQKLLPGVRHHQQLATGA